jgi:hypothetical protein
MVGVRWGVVTSVGLNSTLHPMGELGGGGLKRMVCQFVDWMFWKHTNKSMQWRSTIRVKVMLTWMECKNTSNPPAFCLTFSFSCQKGFGKQMGALLAQFDVICASMRWHTHGKMKLCIFLDDVILHTIFTSKWFELCLSSSLICSSNNVIGSLMNRWA